MSNPTRILVVDDNAQTLEVLSELLRSEHYQVWNASTGKQAIALTRDRRPDVVLLDVMLPDLSGIDVCRQIKSDPALPDVFVVLISGEATHASHKARGLETGADEYISKPFVVQELLARIRTIVRLQQTTAALRAKQLHYRSLIEIMPDAVVLVDQHGKVREANPRAAEVLDYASPEDLVGKSVFDLTPHESHEHVRQDMEAAFKAGTLRAVEHTAIRKDGRTLAVELSAAATKGHRDQTPHLLVIARDITARKEAEARIRELMHTLDQANDAIIIRDLKGYISYFNCGAERLLGWSAKDIRGGQFQELLIENTAEFDLAEQRVLHDGEWEGELQLISRDRQRVAVHSRWTLVHADTGQSPRVVCINTDVTKRKRAEAHLRLQSAALESAGNAIIITDRNGEATWANPAFTRLTGYSVEEVAGKNLRLLQSGKHDKTFYRNLWETILAGRVWTAEMVNRRKDGKLYNEENTITPVRDERGHISHFVAVKQDITVRTWTENLRQVQRDFGIFLSTTNDLKSAAERLLDIALHNEGLDCGAVYLFDQTTGNLSLAAHRRLSQELAKRLSDSAASSLALRHADAGQTGCWRHTDPPGDAARKLRRKGLLILKSIPVQHDGRLEAILNVGSHQHEEISPEVSGAIDAIAAQAGGAIARIRAEQLLRTNRQLLEKTLHSIRSAVLVIDTATHKIQSCNPAATAIFGYAAEELIGQSPAMLHQDHTTREEFLDRLAAAVERQGFLSEFEFKLKRKDGTVFPTEHSVMPIRDDKGRIQSWVGVIRDISEQKRTEDELRNLSRRIIQVQEAERLRVARDLHDGVNQLIASARMRLRKVEESFVSLSPAAREMLARSHDLLVKALEENRRIAQNLRPSDLDEFGLAAACRSLCRQIQSRTSLAIVCRISKARQRLPPAVELNFFRVVQEALNNVEKHARAKTVRVQIARQKGWVVLRIQDDGRGFTLAPPASRKGRRSGAGFTNMRERAASLGGSCTVESAPRRGTVITVRVPCEPIGTESSQAR